MEIRKLEAFAKVVELNSFSQAAETIFLTQPTVSQHIRDLEAELNQKLLDRLAHSVVPTPAGKLLYRYAQKILQTRNEAVEVVSQYGINLSGRINVGCGTIPGTYILPKLLATFRQSYPTIKTTLQIGSSRSIAKQVISGEVELGVIGAKWHDTSLDLNELFADELVLVLPPDHRWKNLESVPLDKIVTEPFILREQGSGTRKTVAQFLARAGLKEADLKEIAEIGSTAAIKEAIKGGMGISILSRLAITDEVKNGDLVTIPLTAMAIPRSFYLITRKNRELSPGGGRFKDYLLSYSSGGTLV